MKIELKADKVRETKNMIVFKFQEPHFGKVYLTKGEYQDLGKPETIVFEAK